MRRMTRTNARRPLERSRAEVLDVDPAALLVGTTAKAVRGRIARRATFSSPTFPLHYRLAHGDEGLCTGNVGEENVARRGIRPRSGEHTSELKPPMYLVCS